MQESIIYFRELDSYKNASENVKKSKFFTPDRFFNLTKLGDRKLVFQMDSFIRERGKNKSPLSIKNDLYPFHQFCDFVNDMCSEIDSIGDITEEEMVKRAKIWLLKNQKKLFWTKKRITSGTVESNTADLIKYIRKIYSYLYPINKEYKFENDRWYIEYMPINIKCNPTKSTNSISFEKIKQAQMKNEIKEVIYFHLMDASLGTVLIEMTAINRFSEYLSEKFPEVESLEDVDRELFERYLIHTNTEATGRQSYSRELGHLKSVFVTAGKILENKKLENLFYQDDTGKPSKRLYKVYSDNEIKRLNSAIVEGDPQVARVLFIHQLLGTRISEVLTLKQDAIYEGDNGKLFIRVYQIKTNKIIEKPINDDIKKLFAKACEYTNRKYGNCEYVFVNDRDCNKPMQYSKIKYHISAMVHKNDLRDDKGELFGVGTHIWRHCYGKKLTELHVDDATIAKLLGHSNMSSLKFYRQIGNQQLAEETRDMRKHMDDLLIEITKDWI